MAAYAEGGSDGVTAAGPDNTYDGCVPCSDMDGNTDQDVKGGLRIRQSWQQGEDAPASSGFALGQNRPD